VFEVGKMYLEGRGVAADPERGMKMIRDASVLGSPAAQFFLGTHYETGEGVEQDRERAQRAFRLCAASGQAPCQFRLASLLLNNPVRRERDYIQAIAWLDLAGAQGSAPASALLEKETPHLTAAQKAWAADLKSHLLQPHR
jgi:TPR repeat protein